MSDMKDFVDADEALSAKDRERINLACWRMVTDCRFAEQEYAQVDIRELPKGKTLTEVLTAWKEEGDAYFRLTKVFSAAERKAVSPKAALRRLVAATDSYDKFLSDQGMHEGPNDSFAVEKEVSDAMDDARAALGDDAGGMSASKRVAAKVREYLGKSRVTANGEREITGVVNAEYAPLIEAVRDEISSCPGCDGCGIVGDDYTDDEEICGECEALRSALAHIEGDATP